MGAAIEDKNDEEYVYVINSLNEHAELNTKKVRYSIANQKQEKKKPKENENGTEMKLSKRITNHRRTELCRTKDHVKNVNANESFTSREFDIGTVNNSSSLKEGIVSDIEMNRENLYQWTTKLYDSSLIIFWAIHDCRPFMV